jgi:Flp pilus assembly protein TadD
MYRGIAKYQLNQVDAAIADFSLAITLVPKSGEAWYLRGVAYYKQQKKEEACLEWSKAGELGYMEAYTLIKEYCQ